APSYTVQGGTYDNVGAALGALDNAIGGVVSNNLVKQNDEDNTITIGADKAGQSISLAGTDGNRKLSDVADGVDVNDAATVGQLQRVTGYISSHDDSELGGAKATGQNSLAVGAGAVSSGKLSTASGAGSQASGTNSSAFGNNAKATAENATAIGQDAIASGVRSLATGQNSKATGAQSVALGHGSVADRDNSVSVGSAGNERQITNVKAGTTDTDAVNVQQLNDKADKTIRTANQYTNSKFSELNKSINHLSERIDQNRKRADAGIAGSMAMTAIPMVSGKDSSFGMAVSGYRDQGAIATGMAFRTSDSSAIKVNASWDSQSGMGVAAGFSLGW
ncbi:YadA-like family protein, partial [Escherichia coli]|uniref:YadA family autotransporter adhesin n=1 Tax=Escherichia coli TaxID=562 RepID=UPI002FCAEA76